MNDLHTQICRAIAALGGRAYLVGGYVRDRLLGLPSQDIDCEVHGLDKAALHHLLCRYGEVDTSGEAFGVYTLKSAGYDFALPRMERRTGSAHTDFEVTPMPNLTARQAAARRDFTVNAMMMDALTGEIIDPYGGQDDLRAKVLRAVPGGQFEEDPLRVLRGAQFAARFDLTPEEGTLAAMRRMPLDALSAQRVLSETKKALLQAARPGIYMHVLCAANALKPWFCAFTREDRADIASAALDRAAVLRDKAKEPLGFMLAAMTAELSADEAEGMMRRLGVSKSVTAYCLSLTAACKKMQCGDTHASLIFDGCACPQDLALLCVVCGENEQAVMERLAVYEADVTRIMPTGNMLMAAGVKPGPNMRAMLAAAREKTLLGMDALEAVNAVVVETKEPSPMEKVDRQRRDG